MKDGARGLAEDGCGELESVGVWHIDDQERYATFRQITEATRFRPGVGLPGRVLSTGKPLWIMDVTQDANFPRAKAARDIGVKGAFGFPLLARGGSCGFFGARRRVRLEGFEPNGATGNSHNRLRQTAFFDSAESSAPGLCVSDAGLKKLIVAWPALPENVKAGILALVQATRGPDA